jgi:[ribosomal protein S5]-alanine N-acetyltransferase
MQLETDRLLLRSLQPQDVAQMIVLVTDPSVTRFLGGPRDAEQVRTTLQNELVIPPRGRLGQWPVLLKATGTFVGGCGLISKEIEGVTEVELVYAFVASAWGKGYATEIGLALLGFATEELRLTRVVALIDPENLPSKRVAEKLGMQRESIVMSPDGNERELWATEAAAGGPTCTST